MNSIQITARLTADPQTRTVGELQICDLRVAIPRRKSRDGSDRGAVFVDVTAFGPLAAICGKYLAKGRRVAVAGRLELEEWEAEDGNPRRRHKIVAEQVEFLDPANRTSGEPAEQADSQPTGEEASTDELAAKRAEREVPGSVETTAA
jgi:single-strand DNA-binding protein